MALWQFLDYVDDGETNVIERWVASLSKKARVKFQTRLEYLRATPKQHWGHYTGPMTGRQWAGIYEIRFTVENVQYRPLFCFGPRQGEVTILMGAEERGGSIDPASASDTCRDRRAQIQERKHVKPHDFSS